MDNPESRAERAIAALVKTGEDWSTWTEREAQLEADRCGVKQEAIRRIMASGDNPLTGRPHSASSAEAIVERDHEYYAHLGRQREAVYCRMNARTAWEAARLTAELAIALVRSREGVAV
jgi:hypothetical protein